MRPVQRFLSLLVAITLTAAMFGATAHAVDGRPGHRAAAHGARDLATGNCTPSDASR